MLWNIGILIFHPFAWFKWGRIDHRNEQINNVILEKSIVCCVVFFFIHYIPHNRDCTPHREQHIDISSISSIQFASQQQTISGIRSSSINSTNQTNKQTFIPRSLCGTLFVQWALSIVDVDEQRLYSTHSGNGSSSSRTEHTVAAFDAVLNFRSHQLDMIRAVIWMYSELCWAGRYRLEHAHTCLLMIITMNILCLLVQFVATCDFV